MIESFRNRVFLGDSAHMEQIPDGSIDALVTDPPAGISFMGRAWDGDKGGREAWCREMAVIFTECLRVMKPGAHGLVWALPRTSHWTACALEDAGFEIRDVVTHLFGSGFPKSLDVSKALDKAAGVDRTVIGTQKRTDIRNGPGKGRGEGLDASQREGQRLYVDHPITAATSEAARAFDGWGTALKPGSEHWILVRRPIAAKNVAANILKHGTGAINIDASRIEYQGADDRSSAFPGGAVTSKPTSSGGGMAAAPSEGQARVAFEAEQSEKGRWPANVVLSHGDACVCIGTRTVRGDDRQGGAGAREGGFYDVGSDSSGNGEPAGPLYGDEDVLVYLCAPGCPVKELDRQSGDSEGGSGASRFFFVAKPSMSEKNANITDGAVPLSLGGSLEGGIDKRTGKAQRRAARNSHPTVKPTALMCYLIRMITPPGGVVLDPFAGSGTTLVAAESLGFSWVGFEREPEYVAIAEARLSQRSLFNT
jgi:DNA modification methylase